MYKYASITYRCLPGTSGYLAISFGYEQSTIGGLHRFFR